MAKLTKHHTDAGIYTQMLARAKTAYHRAFWNASSQCYGKAQTGNALAIAAAVVPPELFSNTLAS
eukprot:SAG31_NODE_35853_length_319_cov_0.709091_1_plen_64_part_10